MTNARTAAWVRPTSTKRTPDSQRARGDLARIYHAAIAAVDPRALVSAHLTVHGGAAPRGWLVLGAGKAAARMAAGCEAALGCEGVAGFVVTAEGCDVPLDRIESAAAGHPMPDARGTVAAARVCRELAENTKPVIMLISGGASALLAQPAPPVTLAEKVAVNALLLRCDASIEEVNCVRKHLSLVKGGGLLRWGRARPIRTLILSDVIGDDPSVIGSGPTVPDPTTFADALQVLRRHHLEEQIPSSVLERLRHGAGGTLRETVKPGSPDAIGATTVILGNNRTALDAAAAAASTHGYHPVIVPAPLVGDTGEAARLWARQLRDLAAARKRSPWCVIAGGETTVQVYGPGRGGRNQEFALHLVESMAGADAHVLSAGTDGIDGPTDAAGAFVDGGTADQASRRGLSPAGALRRNDSYGFFRALGDLFLPGPTGTNVADIKIAVGGLG